MQFMRSVCWRTGRSGPPRVNTSSGFSRRASNRRGGSTFVWAAASSIASGKPSSRAQIAAMSWAFWILSWGQAASSSGSSGAAAGTCSKLSSSNSRCLSRRKVFRRSNGSRPLTRSPSACAILSPTCWGVVKWASSTEQYPSAKSRCTSTATCKARRDLPIPPGPVMVKRRIPGFLSRVHACCTSCARPISAVRGWGMWRKSPLVETGEYPDSAACGGNDRLSSYHHPASLFGRSDISCVALVTSHPHTERKHLQIP